MPTSRNALRRRQASSIRPTRRRPLFETLEDRSLLAAIAPPDGLVSWWTGDNTAVDLAGVHNGTLSGGTTYTAGKVGQAFRFDGINDTVLLAGTFGGGPEATIEAWVKSTGSTGDFQAIVSAVESYFVHLQLGTGGNNVAYTNGDVVGFPIIPTTPAGEYRHVAMSLKSGDSRLYVNGELAAVSPVTYSTLLPTSNLRIGSGYQGGRYFMGEIDEISYYDRALSAADVQHIYAADSAGKIKNSVYIAANAVSVSEGAAGSNAVATFDLKRVGNLSGPVTVDWSTADRTATATSDYASASGQVVFADGQSQQTIQVTLHGDDIPEADETFSLVLSTASPGYQMGGGLGVILNDDLGVSISDATATEGGTALKILDRFVQANSGRLQRPRTPLFGPDANGDGAQDLYVVSADTDKILLYDGRTGDFLRTFVEDSGRLINPGDIAFGPDGNLYVSSLGFPTGTTPIPDAGKVLRYDGTTGAYLNTIMTGLSHPLGVAVASDGTVYAASQDSDQVFRTKGGVTSVFIAAGSGGLNQPRNVLIGPDVTGDGHTDLYVSSQSYDAVLRYNGQTGAFIDKFASTGLGTGPSWIEFAPDGTLVATALTTTTCCNISFVRFNGTTGAKIDQLDVTTLGWAFKFGPDGLIYGVYMTAGLDSYVDRVGPSSLAAFTVSLNATSAAPVSVDYATSPGSAGADDFSAASGTITFAPGETSRVVLVPTLDDAAVEASETFTVNLSNPIGGVIVDDTGVGAIQDDDASRTISISDSTATEGSRSASKFVQGNFNTLVFGPDNNMYSVGGGQGYNPWEIAHYDGTTGAFIGTFASGSSANQFRDLIFHTDGYLYVASINTNEVLRFDGTTGQFVDVFVAAGSGIDAPDGLAFGADANGDGKPELYVTGWLSHSVVRYDGASGQPLGTYISSGSGGLNFPFDIEFNGSFAYVTSAGTDQILKYNATTGAFVGVAASIGIDYPRDVAFGPEGLMYVSSGNNDRILRFTASGTYVDDFVPTAAGGMDNPRALAFDPNGNLYVAAHGSDRNIYRLSSVPEIALTLSLSSSSALPVDVTYATQPDSAQSGSDFFGSSGTITFAPGQTSRTIFVQTVNDATYEGTETFTVNISNPVGGVIADSQGVGTIIDDDLPPTKFYVVDDATANRTYEYAANGTAVENYNVASGNSAPRGAASNLAGDKVWVVDANRNVYVYGPDGSSLGSWSVGGFNSSAQLTGIATNGTDIWIVDAKSDKAYRFTGAASRLNGSQSAASSFSLNSGNKDASDLVTDGTSVWVVNNSTTDKVFKYTVSGTLQTSWTITGGGGSPTGITIDPSGGSDMWIVDSTSDKVYRLAGARTTTGASVAATQLFALAPGNTNPQGIADPPASSADGLTSPLTGSSTASSFDSALLAVVSEWDGLLTGGKKRK